MVLYCHCGDIGEVSLRHIFVVHQCNASMLHNAYARFTTTPHHITSMCCKVYDIHVSYKCVCVLPLFHHYITLMCHWTELYLRNKAIQNQNSDNCECNRFHCRKDWYHTTNQSRWFSSLDCAMENMFHTANINYLLDLTISITYVMTSKNLWWLL